MSCRMGAVRGENQFTRIVRSTRNARTKDSFQRVLDRMANSAGRIYLSSMKEPTGETVI